MKMELNWEIPKPFTKSRPVLLFLDSGAFSLYVMHAFKKKDKLKFYNTQAFWDYIDSYASFVNTHKKYIDYYANVDVLHHPKQTWEVQQYLEKEHGLSPVPVIHSGTPIRWLEHYLNRGHDYIAFGGIAKDGKQKSYYPWADYMYRRLCPAPDYTPIVKTHGFAMTAYDMIIRYPWWSVDSSSWAKSAAYGSIYVPHLNNGVFHFNRSPYTVCCSHRSPSAKKRGRTMGVHYNTMPEGVQVIVRKWLDYIQIPLGRMKGDRIIEEGVINHYGSRGVANMRFFQMMCNSLPKWPWAFRPQDPNIQGFDV